MNNAISVYQDEMTRPMSQKPKLLLINPWITDFAAYDFWSKPLGLLYLAAVLEQAGAEVRLIDCMDRYHPGLAARHGNQRPRARRYGTGKYLREIIRKPAVFADIPRYFARYGLPLDVFRAELQKAGRPDAVLVTSGMTYWYPGVQMVIQEIRAAYADVPVFLGGIYATLVPEHARLQSGADEVVAGEAEPRIVELLNQKLGLGLWPARFASLDHYPFPGWHHYSYLPYAVIMTSRGCPLRCSFCASFAVSGRFRMRQPYNVIEEFIWLHRQFGVQDIAFYDDALLTNYQRHLLPIMQGIRRAGLQLCLHTPNGLQCKFIDDEMAREMHATGFRTIRLSLESLNDERQKYDMSKKVSAESFVRAARAFHAAGFAVQDIDAYVLMALPGQPLIEVLRSMAFVHAQRVGIRLAAFSPIPGTVDFQRAMAAGLLPADFDPLLTNNSALPIRPRHLSYDCFNRISLLAKQLNQHLREHGQPVDREEAVLKALCREFTDHELYETGIPQEPVMV